MDFLAFSDFLCSSVFKVFDNFIPSYLVDESSIEAFQPRIPYRIAKQWFA